MSNNLSQLTTTSHIIIMYFQIIDVSTLYKFAICSTKIPCSNLYKATFTTFEIGKKTKKKTYTNALACDSKKEHNCSKKD